MVNYLRKTIQGASYYFIFGMLAAAVGYLVRLVLARNVSVAEFGLFYAVFAFFTFFGLFIDMGLNQSLVKYISEFKAKKQTKKIKASIIYVFLIQFSFTFLFLVIVFILRKFLAENYFKDPLAEKIILILIVWFFFTNILNSIRVVFYGFQNFFFHSFIPFARNVSVFILMSVMLGIGLGFLSIAYAWLLTGILLTILFSVFLLRTFNIFKLKGDYSTNLLKKLVLFGLPVLLSSIGGTLIAHTDILVLTYFRSLSEVGVYSVVLPTSLVILTISRSLSQLMFPISSELWAKKKKSVLARGIFLMQKYGLLIMVPASLTLIFFAELFLRFLFGPEFIVGMFAMQIILIGTVFYMIAGINGSVLTGIGKPKSYTKIILLAAALNIIINILLIPKYGLTGAAIATAVSYVFAFGFSIFEISKWISYTFPTKDFLKTLFAGVVFILSLFLLKSLIQANPWVELLILLILSGAVYLFMIFLLKILTIGELKSIIKRYSNR